MPRPTGHMSQLKLALLFDRSDELLLCSLSLALRMAKLNKELKISSRAMLYVTVVTSVECGLCGDCATVVRFGPRLSALCCCCCCCEKGSPLNPT